MAVTTADCKKAIVAWIKNNPGYVSKQFSPLESELPALDENNWKRESKRKCDAMDALVNTKLRSGMWERSFDCRPYDDQLRAYTYDDGNKIIYLVVQGE